MSDKEEITQSAPGISCSLVALLDIHIQRALTETVNGIVEEYTDEFHESVEKDIARKDLQNYIYKSVIKFAEKKLNN